MSPSPGSVTDPPGVESIARQYSGWGVPGGWAKSIAGVHSTPIATYRNVFRQGLTYDFFSIVSMFLISIQIAVAVPSTPFYTVAQPVVETLSSVALQRHHRYHGRAPLAPTMTSFSRVSGDAQSVIPVRGEHRPAISIDSRPDLRLGSSLRCLGTGSTNKAKNSL